MEDDAGKVFESCKRIGSDIRNLYRIEAISSSPENTCNKGYCSEVEGFYFPAANLEPDNTVFLISEYPYLGALPLLSNGQEISKVFVIHPETARNWPADIANLRDAGYVFCEEVLGEDGRLSWTNPISAENQVFLVMSCIASLLHPQSQKLWEPMPFVAASRTFSNSYCMDLCRIITGCSSLFSLVRLREGSCSCPEFAKLNYEWLKMAGCLGYGHVAYDFDGDDILEEADKDFGFLLECLSLLAEQMQRRGLTLGRAETSEMQKDTLRAVIDVCGLQPEFDALRAGVPIADVKS